MRPVEASLVSRLREVGRALGWAGPRPTSGTGARLRVRDRVISCGGLRTLGSKQ